MHKSEDTAEFFEVFLEIDFLEVTRFGARERERERERRELAS